MPVDRERCPVKRSADVQQSECMEPCIRDRACMMLTSPRASTLAPRRSKKHSTAPSGSATSRMVPSCFQSEINQEHRAKEETAYEGKHE